MTARPLRALVALVLAPALVTATALMTAATAGAAPLDKGHFHEDFDSSFDCDGTPAHVGGGVDVNFTFVVRGNGLAYYRESAKITAIYTNLLTGRSFTTIATVASSDHKIVDNGDGTITIVTKQTGGSRTYDSNGVFVLNDPGQIRYSVVIDTRGTADPDDDVEVDGSFVLLKGSTGRNDTQGRDFCADLVTFTN